MAFRTVHRAAVGALALAIAGAFTGCQKGASDHLAEAKLAIAAKKPDAALIELKNAVAADPKSAEARLLLGQQMLANGDPAAAVIDLRRARELKAPDDQVVPALAEALLGAGQARVLVDQFSAVRLTSPKAVASLATSLALAQAAIGAMPQARKLITDALAADPGDQRAQLAQARITAAGGDTAAALREVDALLAKMPTFDAAWAFKGELHDRLPGQQDEAAAAYAKALEINPGQAQSLTAMIGIALNRNDMPKANAALDALRKAAPKGFHTRYYEARLNFLAGKNSLARTQFQALMSAVPDNPVVLLASGVNELKLAAPINAVTQLGRVVSLAPGNVTARYYLAAANLQLGRPEQATAALAPLLEATAPSAEVLVLAAQARLLQGDANGADALFSRAAKLNSKDTAVRTALALARAAKGDTDAAMRDLQVIADTTDGVEADLRLISTHIARNQPDAALKAIVALEKKQSERPAAYELRGRVLLGQKDLDGARKAFEMALQKDKAYLPAVAQLTELDLQQGQVDAAKKRLADLQTAEPGNARVLLAQASVVGRTGGTAADVRALLERATKVDPRDVSAWLALIELQFNSGNTPAALSTAQAAVAAVPDQVRLLDALARCQLKAGDHRQAISAYGKIIRLAPRDPIGYLGQARSQFGADDLDGASKTLQQWLAIDPKSIEAQRLATGVAMKRKRPKEALSIARNLQAQYPAESFGYALEGEIHLDQANHDAAASAFRKGLDKHAPETLAPRLHAALLQGQKVAEADQLAASWLKAHPKDTAFITYLGDTAFAAKDLPLAQQRFEQALAIDPKLVGALNNMAWLLMEQKKPGALAMAERAAALTSDNPAVLDTLAQAYAADKQMPKAIEALKRAINRSIDAAPLRLSLAKVYLLDNDRNNAVAELEKLVDLGKISPQYREARQMLVELRRR